MRSLFTVILRATALFGSAILVACSPSSSGSASASASSVAPSSAKSVNVSNDVALPMPGDLDVAPLEKALGCGGKPSPGPCHVIEAAKSCKPWSGLSPSGDGRWFGKSYAVAGGKTTESYVVLRSRTVPSGEVGKGQLPARIAIDPIAAEGTLAQAAERTLRASEHHDVPTKGNPFPPLVKDKTDFTENPAMPTVKKNVLIMSDPQTYVCEGEAQQLVVLAPAPGQKGEGRYAEVWPTTW